MPHTPPPGMPHTPCTRWVRGRLRATSVSDGCPMGIRWVVSGLGHRNHHRNLPSSPVQLCPVTLPLMPQQCTCHTCMHAPYPPPMYAPYPMPHTPPMYALPLMPLGAATHSPIAGSLAGYPVQPYASHTQPPHTSVSDGCQIGVRWVSDGYQMGIRWM